MVAGWRAHQTFWDVRNCALGWPVAGSGVVDGTAACLPGTFAARVVKYGKVLQLAVLLGVDVVVLSPS